MSTHAQRVSFLQRQLERIERRQTTSQWHSNRLTGWRISSFFGGIALSVSALFFIGVWGFVLTFFLALMLFAAIVRRHQQVETLIAHLQNWQQLTQQQLARTRLDWSALPPVSMPIADAEHPFAADLDLVGDLSLLRLIDCAETGEGSRRLCTWLTAVAPSQPQIEQRQRLVAELIAQRHLRDKLSLQAKAAQERTDRWEKEELLTWFRQPADMGTMRRWLALLMTLAAVNLTLLVLNILNLLPAFWLATLLIYTILSFVANQQHGAVFGKAMAMGVALQPIGQVFAQLERFSYRGTPHFKLLCAPFLDPAHRPSRYLRRLQSVAWATGVQGNPYLAFLLNLLVPWNFTFAYLLEHHKAAIAQHLPTWLEIWFEIEALSSLANLGWLQPAYTFPQIASATAPSTPSMLFAARQLGHPLLPTDGKVRNDFTFEQLGEVAIITGSNMAGKSSFLKALGLNLALAYAGGPVDAVELQTGLFRLFTSIKISDSVTRGVSYFYAEVQRLKALLDRLAEEDQLPIFFCIDEIFRGTNNRERLIGSRAYIAALVRKRGAGLIATHDLELVKLADEMGEISNYHFRDDLVDGKMHFDYQLHPGPCPTTNALKIMHNAGLPV